MLVSRENKAGFIESSDVAEVIGQFFVQNDYKDKRVLMIIPDNTRSGPIGEIFKNIYDHLSPQAKTVDCLVALGTHRPLTEEQICTRLSLSDDQRSGKYSSAGFFNHEWAKAETFTSIGTISSEEIGQLSDGLFCEEVDVAINKMIFDYDELFILGPVFPHEVVGFSGGHKYIFPGIAGWEVINFFHWLGAVITNLVINGHKWTPTRRVVEKAAELIDMPRTLFAIVALESKLKGLYIGDVVGAWEKAADLSSEVHIVYEDRPYKTVLGIAPDMYQDIWTAGKVMYKLEQVVAEGGTLIIYAPHISELSYTHGTIIDQIGYHTRDYFLKQQDKFKGFPRAVLAHSTHVKGIGTYNGDVEQSRINVVLATGINKHRCEKVNLGYMDPGQIDISSYENREDEGTLLVHNAGEILYRLRSRSKNVSKQKRVNLR
jgi:nickel-dependent lactate racemase